MISEGLLWFDDDARRPLLQKIADAIARYSERTGWRPSICEAHPKQAEAALAELAHIAAKEARKRTSAKASASLAPSLPPGLRIMPNPAIRPNYFLIGIAEGERPRKATTPSTGAARRASRSIAASSASAKPAPQKRPTNSQRKKVG